MTQMFEQILVTVNETGLSERVVETLRHLPSHQPIHLTLLHVIAPQITAEAMAKRRQQGEDVLAASQVKLAGHELAQVTVKLLEGDPKEEVLRVAEEIDATLIVLGSRGMNRLAAILQNSVSQYVFQLATRPLLIVRDHSPTRPMQRIMVAVDGSEASAQALTSAMAMVQDIKGGQILLARVQSDLAAASHQPALRRPEVDDAVLAKAVARLRQAKITYRVLHSVGDPGQEIVRLAADSHADLLLLGSPDRRPNIARHLPDFERLLGKSVSDYVRLHAACPVLMTRPAE